MIKDEFLNIKIPSNIDIAIDKGVERASRELKRNKSRKIKISAVATAACLGLFISFAAINPALASSLPVVGTIFEAIEKNIFYPANYSQYATSVNETVSDHGLNVTLSEILCDGEGLYVTYKIESDKPFKYTSWGEKQLDMNQLLTKEAYNKVSFSDKELDNSGFGGLEGKFIDDKTFIGMERYYLGSLNTEIPESFDFQVKLNSIGTHSLDEKRKGEYFNGTWAFKIPVKVDRSISKNIDVNYKEANGFSINSILITPFQLLVKSTNPENIFYGMKVLDDKNNELNVESGKLLEGEQLNYFSPLDKDSKTLRIIIYRDKLEKRETSTDSNGTSETTYDNLGEEILLEKTIEIK